MGRFKKPNEFLLSMGKENEITVRLVIDVASGRAVPMNGFFEAMKEKLKELEKENAELRAEIARLRMEAQN